MGSMDGRKRRGGAGGGGARAPRKAEMLVAGMLLVVFLFVYTMSPSGQTAEEARAAVAKSQAAAAAVGSFDIDTASLPSATSRRAAETSSSSSSSTFSSNQDDMPEVPSKEEYPEQPDEESLADGHNEDEDADSPEVKKMEEESIELIEKQMDPDAERTEESAATQSGAVRVKELGNLLFSDGAEYLAAPVIEAPASAAKQPYSKLWSLQQMHDEFFGALPHRRYIPRLAQRISRQQFHEVFRSTSTPVIIPFHLMRHLGFLTEGWTLSGLRKEFPWEPSPNQKPYLKYHSKAGLTNANLDFGPGLHAIEHDTVLAKASGLRNYPRNMMIGAKYMAMMNISYPPFVPKKRFQVPTMWMGTSTSDTKLHHDCCDNWVSMVQGTKRWFIAPPTEAHKLAPVLCTGKHQSLCWASVKYPNDPNPSARQKAVLDSLQSITIDLNAGEMLYLPAGWWHHIQNLGPTVMVNFWTRGCENVAIALDKDPLRSDRPDFTVCPKVARDTNQFISMV
ncbi:Bifunctional arginine demethylase and lysyl-hydroxylase JMJD6 [Hondaea fermentalgiana]|uniref:Bifunctional arginine demethylase and lysyl-hydroxylase JMJD6 n=1 Tax=Hondaea fermentalgiana TaxID=2315210 RepID=A0A2R5GND8_9STRA|nr:Bifunctional arginine demethylase and lysyl-hydroxylase JMJD6 [Hondaea fermentalgiana]|eukprot:GBG31819.1 Bifunctional arginine demethylase and lysyl-hydroxylase JMJD6 [Hondaea fermentalgiana]